MRQSSLRFTYDTGLGCSVNFLKANDMHAAVDK